MLDECLIRTSSKQATDDPWNNSVISVIGYVIASAMHV
jgi:hypothetical protein